MLSPALSLYIALRLFLYQTTIRLIAIPLSMSDITFSLPQTLNLILLTSRELLEVRQILQSVSSESAKGAGKGNGKGQSGADLFIPLYRSWCHNPTATLSLCLLSRMYEQATYLINSFAEIEITVGFLVEIDKLVQLIESPIFTQLRLQLLEPRKYPYLYKALYGLLMLLPQSGAFESLKARLMTVSTFATIPLGIVEDEKRDTKSRPQIDFKPLLEHFKTVQERHWHATRVKQEKRQTGGAGAGGGGGGGSVSGEASAKSKEESGERKAIRID